MVGPSGQSCWLAKRFFFSSSSSSSSSFSCSVAALTDKVGTLQVEQVCLLCQCLADAARWEDGLKACENAMSVLPSAAHLPVSQWKVTSDPVEQASLMSAVVGGLVHVKSYGSVFSS